MNGGFGMISRESVTDAGSVCVLFLLSLSTTYLLKPLARPCILAAVPVVAGDAFLAGAPHVMLVSRLACLPQAATFNNSSLMHLNNVVYALSRLCSYSGVAVVLLVNRHV